MLTLVVVSSFGKSASAKKRLLSFGVLTLNEFRYREMQRKDMKEPARLFRLLKDIADRRNLTVTGRCKKIVALRSNTQRPDAKIV